MGQILSTSQEALQQEQKTVELLKGAKVGLTTDVMFCYIVSIPIDSQRIILVSALLEKGLGFLFSTFIPVSIRKHLVCQLSSNNVWGKLRKKLDELRFHQEALQLAV